MNRVEFCLGLSTRGGEAKWEREGTEGGGRGLSTEKVRPSGGEKGLREEEAG